MKKNDNYNIKIIIATIISTILMVLWMKYYGKKTIPQEINTFKDKKEQEQIINLEKEDIVEEDIIKKEKEINSNIKNNMENIDKKLIINTDKLKGSINLKGLIFNNLILEKYNKDINSIEKVQLLSPHNTTNSYFVEFGWKSNDKSIEMPNIDTIWNSDSDSLTVNNPVILSYTNKNNIIFQVIISIDQNYMFTFRQVIVNNTNNTINLKIFNQIIKKNTEIDNTAGVHEGFIGSFDKKIEEIKYKKIKNRSYNYNSNFSWAGFTDKYWLVSIAATNNKFPSFDIKLNYNDTSYITEFISENITINSNQKEETELLLFTGPKILNLLDQYAFQYDLPLFDRAVDFGWFYFLTKPIYIVLKTFYNFFGNFGVAILFLTFVVKSIMYPFTKKSFISMAKMKEAQPKIDALKARYGNDKMKMNKELIELYKKENISPLSGCLPMLVQIPVFFSLYKVLAISIDMRQAPFFGYIKNLAAKDPTTIWNFFGILPFDVSFFQIGLLPCLMSLTMWLQQKMSSQVGSSPETQAATKFMPIIFLIMFASMPAGLLIYWTFSNIITIGQQYYVENKFKKLK